jgi:hypothetical protein
MSRRGKRHAARSLLPWLVALALVLVLAGCTGGAIPAQSPAATPAAPVAASDSLAAEAATASPAAGAQAAGTAAATPGAAGTSGGTGTPAATGTPAPTPTATATLTDLQNRLALAKAYLDGKDYENAATLYSEIVQDSRGNADALQGLSAALAGMAAIQATQLAPLPTETPVPTPVEKSTTLASETRAKVSDFLALALALLLVVAILYLFSAFLRWLLTALRELWYTKILPLFSRPAVAPGFLINDFANLVGAPADSAVKVVPIAITQKLIAWNQLVQDKLVPVEMVPDVDLGAMAWLKVLWSWILPRPRGYRVNGTLLTGPAGLYQLAVQRTNLGRNSVDRTRLFESGAATASEAYVNMAEEAAKWLILPADLEADAAVAAAKGFASATASPASASAVFDQALATLLPVRQQVNQGQVDFPDARRRMSEAEAMVAQLPSDSELRAELTRVIADLRKSVPGG